MSIVPRAGIVVARPDDAAVWCEDEDVGEAAAGLPSVVVGILGVVVRRVIAAEVDAIHKAEDVGQARFISCNELTVLLHVGLTGPADTAVMISRDSKEEKTKRLTEMPAESGRG